MSLKKPQESGSYMDNVKVKIAEEYKPPPKINIPMTHNQRLKFNNHILNSIPNYDFSMESNILSKVKEWKSNRSINEEQRRIRLQKLKEKEQAEVNDSKENEEESTEKSVPSSNTNDIEVSSIDPTCTISYSNGMLMPTKPINYYSNILQPIPLPSSNGQSCFQSDSGVKSPFNLSEFEADTSSPFDSVALKSINDVEELAKVLKIEDATSKPSPYSNFQNINSNMQSYPNYSNMSNYPTSSCSIQHSGINGYYNSCDNNPIGSFNTIYQHSPPANNYVSSYQLHHNSIANTKVSPESVIQKKDIVTAKSASTPNDPFDELPKNLQEFSKNISSMGFPLSRVARTCKMLGNDNKKVVDHLLAMSELLDLGFAEDKISEALLQSDNDRDKALDKLIS